MTKQFKATPWQMLAASISLLAFALLASSCRQIIGIGPEFNVSDAGAPSAAPDAGVGASDNGTLASASPLCEHYCDAIRSNCEPVYTAYPSQQACLEFCALLPPGDEATPGLTNSVSCRLARAKIAVHFAQGSNCAAAGPGGNGICGSNCEAYCLLYDATCSAKKGLPPARESCNQVCPALRDGLTSHVAEDRWSDSVSCRLSYLTSESGEGAFGCSYAALKSTVCVDDPTSEPTCEAFCQLAMTTCRDELAVYEDLPQCIATCRALDLGHEGEAIENTVSCRLYHAHNAQVNPQTHCAHVGPSGDGHCGDTDTGNCDSLCKLLYHGCADQFESAFQGNEAACVLDCSALDGAATDSGYSVDSAQLAGNGFACRLLHAVRALTDPASCEAAFGGAPCF